MVTLREINRQGSEAETLNGEIETLKATLKQVRKNSDVRYDRIYSANYSARKTIENLKAKKQTVLKAVITLILDGLLVMTDDELQERYFVDIGNIVQTRNTIKRSRK